MKNTAGQAGEENDAWEWFEADSIGLVAAVAATMLGPAIVRAQQPASTTTSTPSSPPAAPTPQTKPADPNNPNDPNAQYGKQPKRILGIIPNYRAVSANSYLPPLSFEKKFWLATQDTFLTTRIFFWSRGSPEFRRPKNPSHPSDKEPPATADITGLPSRTAASRTT